MESKLLTLCQSFDKSKYGLIDRKSFFLLAANLGISIPMQKMLQIVEKFSKTDEIYYQNAIPFLFNNGNTENLPSASPKIRASKSVDTLNKLKSIRNLKREILKYNNELPDEKPKYTPAVLTAENISDNRKSRLVSIKEHLQQLRNRKKISPSKDDNFEQSVNIISGETIDYFNSTNYMKNRTFKKVNETIDFSRKPNGNLLKIFDTQKLKYMYSGMQEHTFLTYSEKIPFNITELYFLENVLILID